MKLGELLYNVQISRFLNPRDPEDEAYLAGQPPPPNDKLYLGVFMLIENEGDTPQEVPSEFTVVDTEGTEFEPLPSRSLFALELGGTVPANDQLPGARVDRRQRADPGGDGAVLDRRGRDRGPAADPRHPVAGRRGWRGRARHLAGPVARSADAEARGEDLANDRRRHGAAVAARR